MKNSNRCPRFRYIAAVFLLGIATSANAALYSRLNGDAVYDSDLNITWATNANINGLMTWAAANTWASNLVLDGISGWRLPTSDSCFGSNCTGSEMGHLFYTELGGAAGQDIATTHNANYNLFSNLQSNNYWSGTEYAPGPSSAWVFYFGNGGQQIINKVNPLYAMAVWSGDVAAVPLPAAIWLFSSGLLGLVGMARRRKTT